jgi:hypothetical protein
MSESLPQLCPNCGQSLPTDLRLEQGVILCPGCGARLPIPDSDALQTGEAPKVQPAEPLEQAGAIREIDRPVWDLGPELAREPISIERKINIRGPGEFLAVLALIVPLVVECVLFLGNIESETVGYVIGFAIVFLTAVLLAIDAAYLGVVDLKGNHRASPLALFFGVILLWIVFYPLCFFRRRHFGTSNFGVLALVVAAVFVAGPYLSELLFQQGVLGDKPPSCTNPEVISLLDDTIRKTPLGPQVMSIRDHREIDYDPVTKKRTGQCEVRTITDHMLITYSVTWIDRSKRYFQVQIEDQLTEDPPACTDPKVIALLESMIKDAPDGQNVNRVDGHKETRYDKAAKIRYGQCTVRTATGESTVAYLVRWLDRKQGHFQVQLVP